MSTTTVKAFCLLVVLALLAGGLPVAAQGEPPGTESAPEYNGWVQRNTSGFGSPANTMISALEPFNGYLYAGTWREPKGQVWRSLDGKTWVQFSPNFTVDTVIRDLTVFKNRLYLAAGNDATGTAEIWRSDGSSWQRVAENGLGDANNANFVSLIVFKDALYTATSNGVTGVEIWRSASGDPGSWTQVNPDGFGGQTSIDITLAVFNGKLYVGFGRLVGGNPTLAELWASENGTSWDDVFSDGLGDTDNTRIRSMHVFENQLYMGIQNLADGGQLWRSADGASWDMVFEEGLGNPENGRPDGMITYAGQLYLVFSNVVSGAEVWQSDDGGSWRRLVSGGWGDANNLYSDYNNKAAAAFKGSLYIGTMNDVTGGQIWMQLHRVYLPLQTKTFGGGSCNTKPTLLFPANGSQISNLIPVYQFNLGNDPAATGSRLQISSDPGFTQVVSSWFMGARTGVRELMDVENLDPATNYYWRTFLVCGQAQGPYSDTGTFKSGSGGVILPAPGLVAPPDGSLLPGLGTTLEWNPVSGSVEYLVHLFNRTGMYVLLDRVTGTEDMAGLNPDTHYSWWIYPRNNYAYGNSSAEWFFDTPASADGAPSQETLSGYDLRVGEDGVSYYVESGP